MPNRSHVMPEVSNANWLMDNVLNLMAGGALRALPGRIR